jgi:hypothetical protein
LNPLLTSWRGVHWPPPGMKRVMAGLPIYEGTHDQLTALSHSLSELMLALAPHIQDVCGGKVPRWMAIPKLVFHVERINLVVGPAKISQRFPDMVHLLATCGTFSKPEHVQLTEWFDTHPGQELVGHRPFTKDNRAFVHVPGAPSRRLRFLESGLAVAPPPGTELVMQDHRKVIRGLRNDAFSDPLATSSRGWLVFMPSRTRKPRA